MNASCIRQVTLLAMTLALAGGAVAAPAPVYVMDTGDGHTTWAPFVKALGQRTELEVVKERRLPADLTGRRLLMVATTVAPLTGERERIWQFVRDGGTLLVWFLDDRSEPGFFPDAFRGVNTDPAEVRFRDVEHPLLRDLRGKTFRGPDSGGDVIAEWDRERWTVLAETDAGAALLTADYGRGRILICQFKRLMEQPDLAETLAGNLARWLRLPERRAPQ